MSKESRPPAIARQKTILILVIVSFIVMALIVLTIVPRLPMPARILVAAMNLILAAVLSTVLRQKFGKK